MTDFIPLSQVTGAPANAPARGFIPLSSVGAAPPDSTPGGWLGREAAGFGAGAGESFGDLMLGAQELAGHALHSAGFEGAGQWLIDDAQSGTKKLKGEAEPYRRAAPTGAFVGDVVGNVPVALGAGELGLASKVGEAALSGAATGALQPTTGRGGFAKEKAEQIGLGAVAGGAAGAAGKGLASAVAPKLGPDAAALAAKGVQLTPGQMAGGAIKRGEDALGSVPFVGSMIRGAQRDSLESFNRAVIDDALAPIGQKLPKAVEAGRAAVEAAQDKVFAAYNALLPKLSFKADTQFATDLANLNTLTAYMPPDQVKQFQKILMDRVANRLGATGQMNGETLKQVESELGNFSAGYRSSSDAAQRQLGDAVHEVQSLLRQNLARQNPQHAAELGAIDSAYARLVRIEGAAANRSGSGGVFTPTDLLTSIKRADKTVRKRGFAAGKGLGQEFAETGERVLPRKVPDSGTPERLAWGGLIGGSYVENPWLPLGLGAASAPYTGPGLRALNAAVRPAGPDRQGAADLMQSLGLLLAPGAAAGAPDVATQLGIGP